MLFHNFHEIFHFSYRLRVEGMLLKAEFEAQMSYLEPSIEAMLTAGEGGNDDGDDDKDFDDADEENYEDDEDEKDEDGVVACHHDGDGRDDGVDDRMMMLLMVLTEGVKACLWLAT